MDVNKLLLDLLVNAIVDIDRDMYRATFGNRNRSYRTTTTTWPTSIELSQWQALWADIDMNVLTISTLGARVVTDRIGFLSIKDDMLTIRHTNYTYVYNNRLIEHNIADPNFDPQELCEYLKEIFNNPFDFTRGKDRPYRMERLKHL